METVPGLRLVVRRIRRARERRALRRLSRAEIFTKILRDNYWGSTHSASGTGSESAQTRAILAELPRVFRELQVRTFFDIPCGDFHWMRHAPLDGIDYVGADIVRELVARNQQVYQRPQIRFEQLDLVTDPLPVADLVLCRDCLVHLPFREIWQALANLQRSGSKYLLTTTFVEHEENRDIRTGQWRTVNLQQPPFCLPPPSRLINEQCTEEGGRYRDKSLGLWRLADLVPAIRHAGITS